VNPHRAIFPGSSSRTERLVALFAALVLVAMTSSCSFTDDRSMDYYVEMRDGERLLTRVWTPAEDGKLPAVLSRGYGPGYGDDHDRFTRAEYVYVGQQTRGRGGIDGSRFFTDGRDGYDTISWIVRQPWSNGEVVMYGKSYWGMTQWLAAIENHPNLKAIIPQNISSDLWQNGYYHNGALSLAMTATGRAFSGDHPGIPWRDYFMHRPLSDLDRLGLRESNRLWQDYVKHDSFDTYWRQITVRNDGGDGKYGMIRIPVFLHSGWFDYYAGSALKSFQQLRSNGNHAVRINIGASNHLSGKPAGRAFPGGTRDEIGLALDWLDEVLGNAAANQASPVRIYVMGANEWQDFETWPPASAEATRLYLHASDQRFGKLAPELPGNDEPASFTYDPADPCPTLGGSHSFLREIPGLIQAGSVDQRANESRDDVLIYSTDVLAEEIRLIGPVTFTLYASSSAVDTDFTVKLLDVFPDGAAYNISEGIVRARFRDSVYEEEKLLKPGEVYRFDIELHPTANVFKAGHRIRIHVSSSNWPLWDGNLNTGESPGDAIRSVAAHQVVYQDTVRPSNLTISVVPND